MFRYFIIGMIVYYCHFCITDEAKSLAMSIFITHVCYKLKLTHVLNMGTLLFCDE